MKQTALLLVAVCVLAVPAHAGTRSRTNPHIFELHALIGQTNLDSAQTQTLVNLTNIVQAAYEDIDNIPNDVIEKLLWALYCQWTYFEMSGGIQEEVLLDVFLAVVWIEENLNLTTAPPPPRPKPAPKPPDSCTVGSGNKQNTSRQVLSEGTAALGIGLKAEGDPGGGTYLWEITENGMAPDQGGLTSTDHNRPVFWSKKADTEYLVKVTYMVGNATCTDEVTIKVVR